MTIPKKQLKITKMFKKGPTKISSEDHDELQEEVRQLEQQLREKQTELFQIQRNKYRKKASPPKVKLDESLERPQRIMLHNSIKSYEQNLELLAMLTGIEVKSYVAGEHCCVVFHMQHDSKYAVKHGLRIEMGSGRNEISAMAFPLGFKLSTVTDEYPNIRSPECLGAIRRALVAYYDRLEQADHLKKLLKIDGQLFKTLDGSHMEVSFFVGREGEDEDHFPLTLMLDYRVYDVKPKNYSFKEIDLPENAEDLILKQCTIFKKKPLNKAFKEAFITGFGPYKMVKQMRASPHSPVRKRPRNYRRNGDDTFLPEECSDQGEEEEDDTQ